MGNAQEFESNLKDYATRAQARADLPRLLYRLDESTVALRGATSLDIVEHVKKHVLRVTGEVEKRLNIIGTGLN